MITFLNIGQYRVKEIQKLPMPISFKVFQKMKILEINVLLNKPLHFMSMYNLVSFQKLTLAFSIFLDQ